MYWFYFVALLGDSNSKGRQMAVILLAKFIDACQPCDETELTFLCSQSWSEVLWKNMFSDSRWSKLFKFVQFVDQFSMISSHFSGTKKFFL